MRIKQQLFRAAKDRLAERHQRALSLALYNRQQAREKVPELDELEDQARRCGFEAARLAAVGADKDKIQAKLAEGDAVRARRDEALRGAGIDPAGLEPVYQCPLCRDTGRINGKTCECLVRMARQLRREIGGACILQASAKPAPHRPEDSRRTPKPDFCPRK